MNIDDLVMCPKPHYGELSRYLCSLCHGEGLVSKDKAEEYFKEQETKNLMHTNNYGSVVINYNSGYDGDVFIKATKADNISETETIVVPFEVLKSFVASYLRGNIIEYIEQMDDDEILEKRF